MYNLRYGEAHNLRGVLLALIQRFQLGLYLFEIILAYLGNCTILSDKFDSQLANNTRQMLMTYLLFLKVLIKFFGFSEKTYNDSRLFLSGGCTAEGKTLVFEF